jgi:hypothetical protein
LACSIIANFKDSSFLWCLSSNDIQRIISCVTICKNYPKKRLGLAGVTQQNN